MIGIAGAAQPDRYDLVILGSGSTAFAAAIRASELGKRGVMTESRILGGICVNRGGVPSKNLIGAADALHTMRHLRYPSVEPVDPRLDFAALIRQKDGLIAARLAMTSITPSSSIDGR